MSIKCRFVVKNFGCNRCRPRAATYTKSQKENNAVFSFKKNSLPISNDDTAIRCKNKTAADFKNFIAGLGRKLTARRFCKMFFWVFLCLHLTACQFAGTIFTGVRKVTTLVMDDRPLNDDVADTQLNLKLRDSYVKLDSKLSVDIDVTVFEGRVLLTGAVPDIDLIDKINETTWCTEGVKKVYNYIRIAEPLSLEKVNFDAAVSAKIRTQLMLTKDVSSSNYKLVMENGTVYIMGIAQNIEELERVVAVIKDTVGVQKVIPLIRYN